MPNSRPSFYRDNARWLFAGLLLTFGSSFGQTYFISLFAGDIRAEFGLSDGDWGGLFSLGTLAAAVTLVFAGRLADTQPLVRLVLGVLVLYAGAACLMAFATGPVTLALAVYGLRFCGQGMMSQLGLTAMARWFRANRGRALGFAVVGYPLGEALFPLVSVSIIGAFGWHVPWFGVAAILLLGFAPLLALLLRRSRTPAGEGGSVDAPGMHGAQWDRREVLRHWSFWAVLPGALAPPFIGTCAIFHQVHIAEVRGYDLATMALGFPMYAALSVTAMQVAGVLVDRYGAVRILPYFLLPLGLGVGSLAIDGGVWTWFTLLAGVSLTGGTMATFSNALWPTLYGTARIGGIKALIMSTGVLATALGPGITGQLIDAGLPFPVQAIGLSLYCFVVAAAFSALAPRIAATLPPRQPPA